MEIIKNIYDNTNHNDYSIKENIKLLKDRKNDAIAIDNKKNFYEQNIMNFKFENIEEYSIEKMYEIYKLIVDISIINSYNLNDLKDDLKK